MFKLPFFLPRLETHNQGAVVMRQSLFFFFHKTDLAITCGGRDAHMFVIVSMSNFRRIRLPTVNGSNIVLVLGTFDEESLGTKIQRNEAAEDRRESVTGNLVLATELKR